MSLPPIPPRQHTSFSDSYTRPENPHLQLERETRLHSEKLARLGQKLRMAEEKLRAEKKALAQTRHHLTDMVKTTEDELARIQHVLIQTQIQLQEKHAESEERRERWLQAASELDRFLRHGRGFNQLTDDEVISKAMQLRYNIRNFSIRHFEQDVKSGVQIGPNDLDMFDRYLKLSSSTSKKYLLSSSARPALVRAFLWAVLARRVFGKFHWAPKWAQDPVFTICRTLGM